MEISTAKKSWTILSLIEWSTDYLKEKGFDDARLNIELLLCNILKCPRINLYLQFDKILSSKELINFKSSFRRRLSHEPLQYILGETEFMGLRFKVDQRVFIPRPETEMLVERAIELCTNVSNRIKTILDIGTGSSNIAVSLAHYLINVDIDAIDLCSGTLDVARENVQFHRFGDRIELMKMDILKSSTENFKNKYDLIISNPPYISKREFAMLQPEINIFEPKIANTDEADGLTFYKAIAEKGKQLLNPNGFVLLEIGYDQGSTVPKIFKSNNYIDVQTFKDYNGIERVVRAIWK